LTKLCGPDVIFKDVPNPNGTKRPAAFRFIMSEEPPYKPARYHKALKNHELFQTISENSVAGACIQLKTNEKGEILEEKVRNRATEAMGDMFIVYRADNGGPNVAHHPQHIFEKDTYAYFRVYYATLAQPRHRSLILKPEEHEDKPDRPMFVSSRKVAQAVPFAAMKAVGRLEDSDTPAGEAEQLEQSAAPEDQDIHAVSGEVEDLLETEKPDGETAVEADGEERFFQS
jgi:hypothetical protein